MKRILTLVCGFTLLLGACANNEVPKPTKDAAIASGDGASTGSAAAVATSPSEEILVASSEKKDDGEKRAKRRAQNHLALKQVSWGDPETVTEDEDSYFFHYETPKRELRLIGQRTLIVNKTSGLVTYQKRR